MDGNLRFRSLGGVDGWGSDILGLRDGVSEGNA